MFCFGQGTENIRKVLKDILKDLALPQLPFESPGDGLYVFFFLLFKISSSISDVKTKIYVCLQILMSSKADNYPREQSDRN